MTDVWAYYRHIYEEWGEKGGAGKEGKERGEKIERKGSARKPR